MDEREILVSRLRPRRKTAAYRARGFGRASGVGGIVCRHRRGGWRSMPGLTAMSWWSS